MNYNEFKTITEELFKAVVMESQDDWSFDDWFDTAHEIVESSAEVIYTANAWDLVSSIRMNSFSLFADAEQALDDLGVEFSDIDLHMTSMAYQILMNQVMGMIEVKFYPAEA